MLEDETTKSSSEWLVVVPQRSQGPGSDNGFRSLALLFLTQPNYGKLNLVPDYFRKA